MLNHKLTTVLFSGLLLAGAALTSSCEKAELEGGRTEKGALRFSVSTAAYDAGNITKGGG